jgi:hypothetical protein
MTRGSFSITSVALSFLAWVVPSSVVAQQESGARRGPGYDVQSEAAFSGTVVDVKTVGPGALGRMMLSKGDEQMVLDLKTANETVRVHLGSSAFFKEQRVEIRNGDRIEVIGAVASAHGSPLVLAREIRSGDRAWTFRDVSGAPLCSEPQRFWTTKRILRMSVAAMAMLILKFAM